MARSSYQFQKRQKELARKKKKEIKRQRKLEKNNPLPENDPGRPDEEEGDEYPNVSQRTEDLRTVDETPESEP